MPQPRAIVFKGNKRWEKDGLQRRRRYGWWHTYLFRGFGLGAPLFSYGGVNVPTGMVFIPFLFGIGLVFYNARNWLGWALSIGSMTALIFGVIANLNIRLAKMSAFDLIVILVLMVGGLGLILRALYPHSKPTEATGATRS